jgi:3-oxocholest-4-en-26-oate---CoA ligase
MRHQARRTAVNENIATIWEAIADAMGERVAIRYGDRAETWAELDHNAERLATALTERGVHHGSLVAIDLWNCPENIETVYACFKLRAVPFNVNFRYRETELTYLLENSRADAIIFDPVLSERVTAAVAATGHHVAMIEKGPTASAPGAAAMEQLVADSAPAARIERGGDDELVIYTGGTTGRPKGVVWPHFVATNQGGLAERTAPLPEHVAALLAGEADRAHVLVIAPLMHATGMFGTIGTLTNGGEVVFCESRSLDADEILRLIERYRVTSFSVIGDAIARPILDALDRAAAAGRPYDLSSVNRIGNTGVIWSAAVKQGLLRHGRFVISDGIASTEGSGFARMESSGEDDIETGKFKLGEHARVVDENLVDVVPGSGQIGYLAATGLLPKGYLNDPEKSALTWPTIGGRRYSIPGDMATLEADGTVTLMGRGSEVINTGGEKVFVEEVEQAILTHPGVYDTLVVGLPDERWGTRVTAVVTTKPGQIVTERELIDHVGTQLADHKRPRQVVFVDAIPRSPTGKADRMTAKNLATADTVG